MTYRELAERIVEDQSSWYDRQMTTDECVDAIERLITKHFAARDADDDIPMAYFLDTTMNGPYNRKALDILGMKPSDLIVLYSAADRTTHPLREKLEYACHLRESPH